MRHQDDSVEREKRVVGRQWLFGENIEPGGAQVAASQGFDKRHVVDEPTARRVDENGARLHPRERGAIGQPLGFRYERQVQRDDVRFGEEVGQLAARNAELAMLLP